ncbi:RNA polymerase sigma factor [Arsenicicoccus bolidensis]|uniref:RNA polymerase sigma factor n=1 Tax=Arsenicicoccus bolidensis TaxID=229480 RepID=A0ABS9Q0I1_9MICO|nr:RNA polymerase sigma factor [Arsenicicoccus bolidensis]MCG7321279.1 RNA polymerase sigma factor [Arsenicicoccus bolidensis]
MTTATIALDVPRVWGGRIVARPQTATEDAVREIYRAHYGMLAGWATKLVGDPDLGHDFATEAFVKLLRHIDTVNEPRAWLFTATGNLVRDHWRKRGREAIAYGKVGDETTTVDTDHSTTLTVRDAVQSLPDRLRMAVMLHSFADLPVATVAEQLGKSQGAVKRDLYDARARLAPILEGVR